MNILVLGGTGSIGGAIVEVLLQRGHQVCALTRSQHSHNAVVAMGAVAIDGDIEHPDCWIDTIDRVDGVVHAAAAWGDTEGGIDAVLVDAILTRAQTARPGNTRLAFIYTGGCWLYGNTGDHVATEESPLVPLASFSWCIPEMDKVLRSPHVRGMVIHPAMVYERNGGVFEPVFNDAAKLGYVRIVHNESVRWPLVHRIDLAALYALMLERGKAGDVYNGATNDGVPIGVLTRSIATRLGITADPQICSVETAIQSMGSWADGYALDQQMSGAKARSALGWAPVHEDPIAVIS